MTVLSIDPGGTTGMATRIEGEIHTFVCKEPEEVFNFIIQCKDVLKVCVVEGFAAQTISTYGLHTVRIIGGVYALCYEHNIKYEHHQPQARYPFQQEAKRLLADKHTVIHEKDALAHLLRYEYDTKSL